MMDAAAAEVGGMTLVESAAELQQARKEELSECAFLLEVSILFTWPILAKMDQVGTVFK